MRRFRFLKKAAMITALSLLVFSCSDNPSSSSEEEGEAPEIPSLQSVQPDLSYFLNNNPQKANQTTTNFNTAKTMALSLSSINSFAQIYGGFFQSASQEGADFKDGAWVWDYTYSYGGESVSIVLSSRESGGDILWDMTWSYQGPEQSFDDYTVITGRTSKDGNRGSWTFNSLDADNSEEIPLLESTWEKDGESKITIETNYYSENSLIGTYSYNQDGSEFSLSVDDVEEDFDSIVNWNTETMTGYYESDGEKKCWDSNFQDTACSN
jgi:hypothetical protein